MLNVMNKELGYRKYMNLKAILVAAFLISFIGSFTSSIYAQGGGNSPISAPISFIRQNNFTIPITGDDACHMFSKFKTDENLPDTATFDGPPGTNPDPDTFRVEVFGIAAGQAPTIQLDVLRGTTNVYSQNFSMVSGAAGGVLVYRTDEHIRLVSNAVDDVYCDHQTVRVKLGDKVKATLVLQGATGSVELPVARPFSEDGPKVIRTANIHFTTLSGQTTDPAATIARMCENWAQVAIRCTLQSSQTLAAVRNVLRVSGSATTGGQLKVNIVNFHTSGAGVDITANITNGDTPEQMAAKLRIAITNAGLPDTSSYDHGDDGLVLVGKGEDAAFSDFASTVGSVIFEEPPLNTTDDITVLEGAILGLNFRDNDPETIEMIAVGAVWIEAAYGIGGGDAWGGRYSGWKNMAMIRAPQAVAAPTIRPFTAGHEFGHVILNDDVIFHSTVTTNLMRSGTSDTDESTGVNAYNASKRLNNDPIRDQNSAARTESGPTSASPRLLKKQ